MRAGTRAAGRQLQRRVDEALGRMFEDPPEAVLAIPGQARAGEAAGTRLPDFSVLWDDTMEAPARWAAEHSARFLAARVAVGTVDQVALGGLQVKYAHLRGASLSRALLVIDEVHASDAYMTGVQTAIVSAHLAIGGHVMLMSATLGAAARRRWFGRPAADFASDAALAYPAVWTTRGLQAIAPDPGAEKIVEVVASPGWSGDDAAGFAIKAAEAGARVLVIRNTVVRAQATYDACLAAASGFLLSVNGLPTLHHSRFAAEDRALLDRAVEAALGRNSPIGGRIVIGTQTLEQSLDLCADILITDLCPMDVLLQRIGRLHRHRRPRPDGFGRRGGDQMSAPALPMTLRIAAGVTISPITIAGRDASLRLPAAGGYAEGAAHRGPGCDFPWLACRDRSRSLHHLVGPWRRAAPRLWLWHAVAAAATTAGPCMMSMILRTLVANLRCLKFQARDVSASRMFVSNKCMREAHHASGTPGTGNGAFAPCRPPWPAAA
ncbi:CRISPR-associated helicase Cas3' [Camelimonas fluminis]